MSSRVEGASLFRQLIGPGFEALDARLRAIHSATTSRAYAGSCSVERGSGLFSKVCGALARLPPPSERIPLRVIISPEARGETWRRSFGGVPMRSRLHARDGVLEERFGPSVVCFRLEARDGVIHWHPAGMRTLGVPWPDGFLHGSGAREWVEDGRYRFEVAVHLRGAGLLVRYVGTLDVDPHDAP